jgi:hypothetical protein
MLINPRNTISNQLDYNLQGVCCQSGSGFWSGKSFGKPREFCAKIGPGSEKEKGEIKK